MSESARPDAPACVAPHIVAVDDDDDVRRVLVEYLSDQDLRVTAVASGREMLAMIESEPIDLLLLDLRLPGEDGLALARRVREMGRIPILILSGRSEEADRVMGLELAADDYITKPFVRVSCWHEFVPCCAVSTARKPSMSTTLRCAPIALRAGSSTCACTG